MKNVDDANKWISVKPVRPITTEVPEDATWQEVEIKLTDEQIADLARLGVKTPVIRIATFDIGRLRGPVQN